MNKLTTVCAWCRRIKDNDLDRWTDSRLISPGTALVSHGICPRCARQVKDEVKHESIHPNA
jgi:hypothetical protein